MLGSGWRTSRSTRQPATSAAKPTGTLTRNTQRQLACTSRPPSGGPAAAAIPPTAAHAPMATCRRSGGNSGSSSPSDAGIKSAAPRP